MLNVSQATKNAFKSDSAFKEVRLYFPQLNLNITNERIFKESLEVKESLLDKKSIEFVGCIASSMSVKISGIDESLVGKRVKVYITADNTDEICLFNGIVDSAKAEANKIHKKIVAYDELYSKGNKDVSAWYNSLSWPKTIKQIRDSLFAYIGLTQKAISLPNDNVSISKQYDPKSLQALAVIKNICQINGYFGIMARDGEFEYRMVNYFSTIYPSETLIHPSSIIYPAPGGHSSTVLTYYRKSEYEEFSVKPVDKLIIRQSDDDAGQSYGTGTNKYIIQSNIFTYGLDGAVIAQMAENIYPNVHELAYTPFEGVNNGLPFLECGDVVTYETLLGVKSFTVLSRSWKGIQAQKDTYKAAGVEYQNEFLSDLKTKVDLIKNASDSNARAIKDLDSRVTALEEGGGLANIVSTRSLPSQPAQNTLYLVQGEIVVIP